LYSEQKEMKTSSSYIKREYKDVAGTFDHVAKSPNIALLGMLPISNKVAMGINDTGIWLWHIDYSGGLTLRVFPHNCPIGFFEWAWIRNIQVSPSRRMAYFSFYNLDTILDKVVLAASMKDFEKDFITTLGSEKVLQFPLTHDRFFSILDHVTSHHYVPVYPIE